MTSQFTRGLVFNFLSIILDTIIILCIFVVILITDLKSSIVITLFFLLIALFLGQFLEII